jgi:hypothetical protein
MSIPVRFLDFHFKNGGDAGYLLNIHPVSVHIGRRWWFWRRIEIRSGGMCMGGPWKRQSSDAWAKERDEVVAMIRQQLFAPPVQGQPVRRIVINSPASGEVH